MSKMKKTLDELFEESLVPEDELLNEIPENWVYYKFGSIIDIQGGTQPPKSQFIEEERDGYVRLIQIRDYKSDKYKVFIPKKKNLRIVNEEDITIARYGASVGQIHTGLSGAINVVLAKVIYPQNIIYKDLLYWLLKTEYLQIPLKSVSSSAQAGFNKGDLEEIVFPLPPLNEQKRIANKIEILFTKLDEAKQLIEEAKVSFELRRVAILEKAFEGEFLSDGLKESMTKMKLEDICISISDGDHQAPPKVEQGIPFLVISNINKGVLDYSSTRFVPEEYYEKINEKSKPMKGDVLYSVVGSYGIPALVEENKKYCFQRHIAILRPKINISSKFLYYVLQTRNLFNQASDVSTGTTQITVPLTGLRKIEIKVPPIEVQETIVNKVEELILKEKLILDEYVSTIDIDMIKQSILSKAFKGELGTNDPTDEPAIELLKSILQEKV
ncbi:specificity determinant for hsdM and hsdR [Bacillus sp. N3536]|nr:specificity determinant for hsdM and hsdR [Bacillus sp. N3536]